MATHSSILAWRILCTEEPGRLWSVGHKELDTTEQLTLSLVFFFFFHETTSALLVTPASLLSDRAPERSIRDP